MGTKAIQVRGGRKEWVGCRGWAMGLVLRVDRWAWASPEARGGRAARTARVGPRARSPRRSRHRLDRAVIAADSAPARKEWAGRSDRVDRVGRVVRKECTSVAARWARPRVTCVRIEDRRVGPVAMGRVELDLIEMDLIEMDRSRAPARSAVGRWGRRATGPKVGRAAMVSRAWARARTRVLVMSRTTGRVAR